MEHLKAMRDYFRTNATRPIEGRIAVLKRLRQSILDHESVIYDALKKDFNKPALEAFATEILMTVKEIDYLIRHLKRLAKPRSVATSLINFPSRGKIYPEPYGLVLIMAPWNYPFLLAMQPLAAAVAAGNVVVVKPGNYACHTSAAIRQIVSEVFIEQHVSVVLGDRHVNNALLDQRFDMIFFTGSPQVGKLVMEKAARHLTPIILELGGKSPCIIDCEADLELAAKRIVWGKFLNNGQTCVAPDYVLVPQALKKALIDACIRAIKSFYFEGPAFSTNFACVINKRHFDRLCGLIEQDKIVFGGKWDSDKRMMEPTILDQVSFQDAIMQEEIFGPILPIIAYESLDEVIQRLSREEKPLALYLFSNNRKTVDRILSETSSGGGCVNDVIMHAAELSLPFGGVGHSGMGKYHGKKSFEAFTHYKGILHKAIWYDMKLKYPPYKQSTLDFIKSIMIKK